MPPRGPKGYAFNRTRTTYLATDLLIARTHWSRFRGLMATNSSHFSRGQGLWINPSHGIHTFAMRFPIDAVYLDRERIVIHIEGMKEKAFGGETGVLARPPRTAAPNPKTTSPASVFKRTVPPSRCWLYLHEGKG